MTLPLERLIWSVIFLSGFAGLSTMYLRDKRRRLVGKESPTSVNHIRTTETLTLLYFWSAACAQCRPQEDQIHEAQRRVNADGPRLNVRKLNALEEAELTRSLNIMTVPTTVLLDTQGKIAAWNPGLTPARTLIEQARTVTQRGTAPLTA